MSASQNQANLKQVRWHYCFCRELELGTGVCMYFPVYHQGGYLLNRPSWHSALVFRTQTNQLPFCIISHCVLRVLLACTDFLKCSLEAHTIRTASSASAGGLISQVTRDIHNLLLASSGQALCMFWPNNNIPLYICI